MSLELPNGLSQGVSLQGRCSCVATFRTARGRQLLHSQRVRIASTLTRRSATAHNAFLDTEGGMLAGLSRERQVRSNPYWFTEFCSSQCSSHFAAPFIVVGAETSIAEICIAGLVMHSQTDRSELEIHHGSNQSRNFGRMLPLSFRARAIQNSHTGWITAPRISPHKFT